MNDAALIYCANHPGVETGLRCKKCDKPICVKCAVRTPTGYQCKQCQRGQQKVFETAEWFDYIAGFVTAAVLSGLASFVISLIGSIGFFGWFLVAAAAPTAGVIIAEAVRFAIRRHRSPTLFKVILAGIILGALPVGIFQLIIVNIFGIVFQAIYLAISVPTAYYRISGIQLFK
jgi:hypothetical protein